jgi:hypothetical protein
MPAVEEDGFAFELEFGEVESKLEKDRKSSGNSSLTLLEPLPLDCAGEGILDGMMVVLDGAELFDA